MKLDNSVDSLEHSSRFLRSLSFSHPKAFQNTLLSRVSITSVIRDAEVHESALFTSSGVRKTTLQVPDSGASEVLRSRDASLETLLDAIDKVCAIYPVNNTDKVKATVDLLRHKHTTLVESIASLERDVDAQRRRLDLLSSGREYPEDEDENHSQSQSQSLDQQHVVVTDDMIRAEEQEILKLEQLIQEKSKR